MDLMLSLISLSPKISAFLIQTSLRSPYAEGTVIIQQRDSRRKTDFKFVNNDICYKQPSLLSTAHGWN